MTEQDDCEEMYEGIENDADYNNNLIERLASRNDALEAEIMRLKKEHAEELIYVCAKNQEIGHRETLLRVREAIDEEISRYEVDLLAGDSDFANGATTALKRLRRELGLDKEVRS